MDTEISFFSKMLYQLTRLKVFKIGKKLVAKELWPPWLPDLSPCDFLLWGYLLAKVHSPMPKNLEDLKANIRREINLQKHLNSYFFRNAKKA
jgi:hypothetical protein